MGKEKKDRFKRQSILLTIIGVGLSLVVGLVALIYQEELIYLKNYGYVGIFFLSLLGNATIFLPVPGILTAFVGGGIFSPLLVGIVGAAGAALGELTGYLAGYGGQAIIGDQKRFQQIQRTLKQYGLVGLFVLASIPNPFFDMAGIAAGVAQLPIVQFLLVTFAGQLVKYLLISFLGAGSLGFFD